MTDFYGVVGTKIKSKGNGNADFGVVGGYLTVFVKDYRSVPAELTSGDRVPLGWVRSDAYLDGDLSKLFFDDMGTAITLDIVADETVFDIANALGTNTIAKLATAVDVATAAGSTSLLAGVATADKHKPLWQQLNLKFDPRVEIQLFAKFTGDPGTGNLSWKIIGS
ncbi:hypothetical protein [Asticcacaulis taihuensis]|uniref:hypothetical protein n=1 Tax=Asticcacaulis taihuensis TaxID=260084 RepID=UPI0026F358E0|nr:hypothetical protein [Asticcacaulis taihuensis]